MVRSRRDDQDDESASSANEDDNFDVQPKHKHHQIKMEEGKMNSSGPNGRSMASKFNLNYEMLKDHHRRVQFILLLIILILGLVLFIIGIKVLIYSMQKNDEICETSDCLFAAARFSHNLNLTNEPCENFYEFACGKWQNDNKLGDYQGQYSISDQIKEQIFLELKHYLDKVLSTIPHDDPFFKAKRFYESCMNLEEIDLSSLNFIKHEIFHAGGWNVIGNWNAFSWQADQALERLHTYYGVEAFFKVTIGADDLDPQLPFIIKIYPAGLGLPRVYYFDPQYKNIVEAYKQYMSEVVRIFEGTKLASSQFAENTFNYEKRIAEITPDDIDYINPSNMFKKRSSIRELKLLAPSIKWGNLLEKYFQKARLNDNTRVLLAFDNYFRNISNIISTTDAQGLNDYLMWKMISTYAPYLSKDFRIIHYNFQQALQNLPSLNSLNDENRWKFCLVTTSKMLGHAMSALYMKNKLISITNKSEELKNEIIRPVQRTILENPYSFIWMQADEDYHKLLNMKIKQMEIFLGHPQFILKPRINDYYNEYFANVKFLQNILESIHHRNRKMEMLLNEKSYDQAWPLLAFDVHMHYDYAGNKLFVPGGMMNVPYYDLQAPRVTQFATFGFHIAAHILKAFDLTGLHYNLPDGRLSTRRKFLEDKELNGNLICLRRQINQISHKLNNTISQTYIDLGALNIAWLAYKQFESQNKKPRLPALPYNNDQLFFISFAQTFCQNIKPKTLETQYETSQVLADSIRVNTLLSQNKHFINVFQCPRPVNQCHLWNY